MRLDLSRVAAGLGTDGAEGAMGEALRWLQGIEAGAEGALDAPLAAIERALEALGEAPDGIDRFAEALDFDSGELERVEERLFEIRGLARKHDCQPDDLESFSQNLHARLDALDGGTKGLAH